MDVVFIKIQESDSLRIDDNNTVHSFEDTTAGPSTFNFTG